MDNRLHEAIELSRNLPFTPAWKENRGIRTWTLRRVFFLASTTHLGHVYALADRRALNPHPHQRHHH